MERVDLEEVITIAEVLRDGHDIEDNTIARAIFSLVGCMSPEGQAKIAKRIAKVILDVPSDKN
jgi:hypothetical protein